MNSPLQPTFWRQATMFGDGAKGLRMQGFRYYYGTQPGKLVKTDVEETAVKDNHASPWKNTYCRGDVVYRTLQEACDAWLTAQPTAAASPEPDPASRPAD